MMPQNDSDVLTAQEVKLIQEALRKAYKTGLYNSVKNKALKIEEKYPLGTHGSIKAYSKGDGQEVEEATMFAMLHSKNKEIAELGKKILDFSSHVFNSGYPQPTTQGEAARAQLIALEDSSPMAASFKVARKLQQNGREQ